MLILLKIKLLIPIKIKTNAKKYLPKKIKIKPIKAKAIFKYFLIVFRFTFIEKTKYARAGIKIKPIVSAESMANVLVNAKGLNNFPSAACIANTGRKLIIVVVKAVITAGATSIVES